MTIEETSSSAFRFVAPRGTQHACRRLREIERELGEIFRSLVEERRLATGASGTTPPSSLLQLRLELGHGSEMGSRLASGGQLFAQMRDAARRLADASAAFPTGKVYCYWCRSFECGHSEPREPRSVFSGYSPTGQPVWSELATVLLDRRDPRVELVYGESPLPVTLVQSGEELVSGQLHVYGRTSGIYRILGQVAAGYLESPAAAAGNESRGRGRTYHAVTFQAVQGGDGTGPVSLNVVGYLPGGTSVLQALEESADPRVHDALNKARRHLSEIAAAALPRRRRGREVRHAALEVLRRLSRNLERIFRQRTRRTRHSEDRRRDKERPASSAVSDALRARSGSIYRDVEERTWIIVGPRNRVHVFNDSGMHVTSVVYPGETVRHRTTKGKWLAPRKDELLAFQRELKARTAVRDE